MVDLQQPAQDHCADLTEVSFDDIQSIVVAAVLGIVIAVLVIPWGS